MPVYLIGDHSRISQILNNLISNAIKFTNNGYIKTRVNYKKLADHKIKLIFTVKDTGIGIKKDSLTQIFQPFTQEDLSTTRKFGGTGLGLAICKQLVHLMNGDIFVKSIVGKGSIFKFSIILDTPVKNTEYKVNTYQTNNKILLKENFIKNISEISKVTNNSHNHDIKSLLSPKILLVEDNEINRNITILMLKHKNYTCDIAINGLEAVQLVSKKKYDIIFMDCQMPLMDGFESTTRIRS